MPRKRFLGRPTSEIFSEIQLSAVRSPITMTPIALPPRIHPATADRPPAAHEEFRTDIRDKSHIVEQVRFERHVERFTKRLRDVGSTNRIAGNGCIAPDDHNRITRRGSDRIALCRKDSRLRLTYDLADNTDISTSQFRKEILFHISPAIAAM